MSARFHHLIAELERNSIFKGPSAHVLKFAEALPDKWTQYVMLLKETKALAGLGLAHFVIKLQYHQA